MGECRVEGCYRAARARGMCQMHYYRFMRNGTTDLLHWRGDAKKQRMGTFTELFRMFSPDGLKKKTAEHRFYEMAWPLEKAITELPYGGH